MPAHIEDDWVARLKSSEPQERDSAIAALRELLLRALNRSLRNRYGSSFDPEDVVQTALIKVLDSLHKFEGRSRFTTWAITIATRTGISELRRRHYQDVSLDSLTSDEDSLSFDIPDQNASSAEAQHACQAMLRQLREMINSGLTKKQQQALRGMLDGLPVEELALRLESNRSAIYKLVHDARSKLKRGMEQAGFAMDEISSVCS